MSVPASSMAGIKAKASALQLDGLADFGGNYEAHQGIALSLADDLIALGWRPWRSRTRT
jgi:hypothetical protein